MAATSPVLAFTVPFPPSVNTLYTGKERRRKSERYEKWCREARQFITALKADNPGLQTIDFSVGAWYRHGEFSDKKTRDAENYAKAISDLLKDEKILLDDSLIRRSVIEWADDIPQGYTEVIIVPLASLVVNIL